MARLTVRIDLSNRGAVGPGKIRLLELIEESGSISAAGRAMNMSYRRAWMLIDSLNRSFRAPLVETQLGGTRGGGAALSKLGREVVARYRAIERTSTRTATGDLAALDAAQAPPRSTGRGKRALAGAGARHRSSLMPRRSRA